MKVCLSRLWHFLIFVESYQADSQCTGAGMRSDAHGKRKLE